MAMAASMSVATALSAPAEIWMNRSENLALAGHRTAGHEEQSRRHRRAHQGRTHSGAQYNHMTTSVCYASSSDGPVHFGLGLTAMRTRSKYTGPRARCRLLHERLLLTEF